MTTVKVKLRRCAADDRWAVVYYQLTGQHKVKRLSSGMRVEADCWDRDSARVVASGQGGHLLQARISRDVARLDSIAREAMRSGRNVSLDEVARQFRIRSHGMTIRECFEAEVEKMKEVNKLGTARNYGKALRSLETFCQGTDLLLADVTVQMVDGYDAFLQRRGVTRNTVSFYMRILRAVYNKYSGEGDCRQANPFRHVYTGVDHTRKRAVSRDTILQLRSLDLSRHASLALCRDLFLFSFYARGMAFVDMAFLKKTDIVGDAIVYVRRKTAQRMLVRMEPCMREIVDRYSSADSCYLFPLLGSPDPLRAYAQYEVALNYYNRQLGRLSLMLAGRVHLTSYTARHTWATMARDCQIPLSVISAGMGHTSERTTEIYLKMVENSVVDDANHLLIESLEKRTSLRKRPYFPTSV